jgi:hypothetical protein
MRDLGGEENNLLRRGLWQLLPQRDRAGRAVLFLYGMENTKYENISVVSARSDWGHIIICKPQILTRSVQSLRPHHSDASSLLHGNVCIGGRRNPKRGFVVVSYTVGQTIFVNARPVELMKSFHAHPARIPALHMCVDRSDVYMGFMICVVCRSLADESLCRFRLHTGKSYYLVLLAVS